LASKRRSVGSAGRERAGLLARCVLTLCAGAAICGFLAPASACGQDSPGGDDSRHTRFASFDIGFGGVKPVDASWGLSYGVAFDVANLFVRGASLRFGFRFWTADAPGADGRTVDLDDSVFDIVLKKQLGPESLGAYAGLGVGAHIVNARYADRIEEQEGRDGFHVGLDGLLGVQKSLADEGFITLFLEGQGSLLTEVSQVALHIGIRIRFDRLGAGG
jgi:hypothetical protein